MLLFCIFIVTLPAEDIRKSHLEIKISTDNDKKRRMTILSLLVEVAIMSKSWRLTL